MITVNTMADLRLLSGSAPNELVLLLGYYTAGDKPPLYYLWQTAGIPYTDDLGATIIPTGSTTGAWIGQLERNFTADHFGVKYNNESSSTALNNAIIYSSNNGGGEVHLSIGNVEAKVLAKKGVKLIGAGVNESGGIFTKISAATGTGAPVRVNADNFELHNLILSGVNPNLDPEEPTSASFALRIEANNFTCSNIIAEKVPRLGEGEGGDALYIFKGSSNLKFLNSKFRYARRNACSLVDGHDVYFENCEFVQGTATQQYLYIFDVEPKTGEMVYNVHLDNCKIIREGATNGNSTFILKSQAPNTMNVVVEKCHFVGTSIRINSENFRGLFVYDCTFTSGFISNPVSRSLLYAEFKRNIFNTDPTTTVLSNNTVYCGDVVFEENIFNYQTTDPDSPSNSFVSKSTFHTNKFQGSAITIPPIDRTSYSIKQATTTEAGSVKQLPPLNPATSTAADIITTMKTSELMQP